MTEQSGRTAPEPRTVEHDTFTLERDYAAAPGRVFAAWSTVESKRRWFAGDVSEHTLDFRVGGIERNTGGGSPGGPDLTFESTYHDIVDDRRIVFTSLMLTDGVVTTVSVTSIVLTPTATGTRLVLTQQGTYLDAKERPTWRQQGTSSQLDALAAELGS